VSERVVFVGMISEEEKADYYRLADVFILASQGEGFGFVLLEAMACGIPVIASKLDGGREAVLEGQGRCEQEVALDVDLQQAVSELEEIRKRFNAQVYFLDCDAGVYASRWISPYEKLPGLHGGGGTDFAPVFEHLIEKRIKPDYCVFFTDGYGNFGVDPTQNFEVLWVLTNQEVKPPFGDVVRVDVDNDSE
jgi:hypothetical protein